MQRQPKICRLNLLRCIWSEFIRKAKVLQSALVLTVIRCTCQRIGFEMTSCGRATPNQSLFLTRYISSIGAPNSLRNSLSVERKSALGETLGRGARRPRFSASSWSNASPVITGSINRSRKTCTGSETRSAVTRVARALAARSLRVFANLNGRALALAVPRPSQGNGGNFPVRRRDSPSPAGPRLSWGPV